MAEWWQAEEFRAEVMRMVTAGETVPWLWVCRVAEGMTAKLGGADAFLFGRLEFEAARPLTATGREVGQIAAANRAVWEKLREVADAEAGPERAAEEARRVQEAAVREALSMRAALEREAEEAAGREAAEAARAEAEAEEAAFLRGVQAEGTAAELAEHADRAIDVQWVKRRSALKVPEMYAVKAKANFTRARAHQMHAELIRRVEYVGEAAAEFKGCGELVSAMFEPWKAAGGSSLVFWHGLCHALYALPSDRTEREGSDAEGSDAEGSDAPETPRTSPADLRARDREAAVIAAYLGAAAAGVRFGQWKDLAAAAKIDGMSADSVRRKVLRPMYAAGEELDARKADGLPWFELEGGEVAGRNIPAGAGLLAKLECDDE